MKTDGMEVWELKRQIEWRTKRLATLVIPEDASTALYLEYDRLRSELEDLRVALAARLTRPEQVVY